MPLPLPTLDSRTWDELTSEGRSLIPRYAPEWTDHNLHDPGITLIELFAWLSELLLFRLDRVTPATMRTFLRLVGVEPEPAHAACTAVAFRLAVGAAPVALLAGTRISDAGGDVVFESVDDVTVTAAWLELDTAEGTSRGRIVVDAGGASVDVTAQNATGDVFAAFGSAPVPGDGLRIGFDVLPAHAGTTLSLYVWTESWESDAATSAAIEAEEREVAAECAPPPPISWPTPQDCADAVPTSATPPAPTPPPLHYSARTVWEFSTGVELWQTFTAVDDPTRALTLSGAVRLKAEAGHAPGSGGRYWIRCRLASGGFDCAPQLTGIAVNAVPVAHAAAATPGEDIGTSRGEAGLLRLLDARPVVSGSTELRVTAADGADDDGWREVSWWDKTGPDDPHYLCDHVLGTIAFGDGRVGRVPAAGSQLTMRAYRVGGGTAGNVPAGRLSHVAGSPAGVVPVQPLPATGGADAETLGHAHGRALDLLAAPSRAVTLADVETIALATPGAPLGRAQALAERHPDFGCIPAPGVVTVVVLPRCGDRPQPSEALLELVRRYLERRRPLTTELHVVGPSYVAVRVTATLHVRRGNAVGAAAAAQAALDVFFDPLHGGPRGTGWPLGRDVIESEVLATLNALPGVIYVDGVGLSGPEDAAPRCGNLALCGIELVDSQRHGINVVEE